MNSRVAPLSERYPQRAIHWKLRTQTLEFGRRPLLMGIVNVTPDSFSEGGQFFRGRTAKPQAAINHALQLVAEGADILDIGGESTRPYANPVAVEEELERVIPIIEALAKQTKTPISIDTSKATVARTASAAGAEIINDVTGLTGDPKSPSPQEPESVQCTCKAHRRRCKRTRNTPMSLQTFSTICSSVATRCWRRGSSPSGFALTRELVLAKRISTIKR